MSIVFTQAGKEDIDELIRMRIEYMKDDFGSVSKEEDDLHDQAERKQYDRGYREHDRRLRMKRKSFKDKGIVDEQDQKSRQSQENAPSYR